MSFLVSFIVPPWVLVVVDLVLVEGVLIGVEVVVEETNGMVARQEGICLEEEDTRLPEVADLNTQQQVMILDPNITQVIYER